MQKYLPVNRRALIATGMAIGSLLIFISFFITYKNIQAEKYNRLINQAAITMVSKPNMVSDDPKKINIAIDLMKKALDINPDDQATKFSLSVKLHSVNRDKEAVQYLEQIIKSEGSFSQQAKSYLRSIKKSSKSL